MAKKKLIPFLALLAILLLIFLPGFSKYQKLASKCKRLRKEIEELQKTNRELEEEKHRLETDIEYIESKAREKLGVVKKGEIPYKIIEEKKKK
jgi:cell division protein FtsB